MGGAARLLSRGMGSKKQRVDLGMEPETTAPRPLWPCVCVYSQHTHIQTSREKNAKLGKCILSILTSNCLTVFIFIGSARNPCVRSAHFLARCLHDDIKSVREIPYFETCCAGFMSDRGSRRIAH